MNIGSIQIDENLLGNICSRWSIVQLEAFGSVLRNDFGPESDIDLLATFAPDSKHSLFDLMEAEEQFSKAFGRKVDLVPKQNLKWVIRDRVLREAKPVYSI